MSGGPTPEGCAPRHQAPIQLQALPSRRRRRKHLRRAVILAISFCVGLAAGHFHWLGDPFP